MGLLLRIVQEFHEEVATMSWAPRGMLQSEESLLVCRRRLDEDIRRLREQLQHFVQAREAKRHKSEGEKRASEEARRMRDETSWLAEENCGLRRELETRRKDLDRLLTQKTEMMEQIRKMTLELSVERTTVDEMTRKNVQLTKEVEDARNHMRSLENRSGGGSSSPSADDKARGLQEREREKEMALQKTQQLRATLEKKNKELVRIRGLAKQVLESRTELEQFFLDSLHYVRSEIEREKRIAAARKAAAAPAVVWRSNASGMVAVASAATAPTGSFGVVAGGNDAVAAGPMFPHVSVTTTMGSGSSTLSRSESSLERRGGGGQEGPAAHNGGSGGGRLADLTWSERERVLALLFSKINRSEEL